jgi:hypothetical protein
MAAVRTGKEEKVTRACCECGRDFQQDWGFVTSKACPECIKALAAAFWATMEE